jgi:hypothetical protein
VDLRFRESVICSAVVLVVLVSAGCNTSNPGNVKKSFYSYDFDRARRSVRSESLGKLDSDTVLYCNRLGMASLADGDLAEASSSLGRSYKIMESGKVTTKSRIVAATIISDNITVWKGEPFEQAMTYYAYAVTRALSGDWQNARAAIRGSLRKLKDFSDEVAKSDKKLKKKTAAVDSKRLAELANTQEKGKKDYDFLRDAGKLVASDFALGYIVQGLAERQLGTGGAALELAVKSRPQLAPLVAKIRAGQYNTILIVDYGRGPQKYNHGPDRIFTSWRKSESRTGADLQVSANGKAVSVFSRPTLNLNKLIANHRWKNLENARKTKSIIGSALVAGGTVRMMTARNSDQAIAGLLVALVGAAVKASAAASIRHNEVLPHSVYLTPLNLPACSNDGIKVRVQIADDPSSAFVVPNVRPGTSKKPAVIYLRLFRRSMVPPYFAVDRCIHSNDHVAPRKGSFPYILGGTCVARPTQKVLAAYQAGGFLRGLSVRDLEDLYRMEGIQFAPGPNSEGKWSHDSYRHILMGGKVLRTPHPYTVGYKQLMCSPHAPYSPDSDRVEQLAAEIRARMPARP